MLFHWNEGEIHLKAIEIECHNWVSYAIDEKEGVLRDEKLDREDWIHRKGALEDRKEGRSDRRLEDIVTIK